MIHEPKLLLQLLVLSPTVLLPSLRVLSRTTTVQVRSKTRETGTGTERGTETETEWKDTLGLEDFPHLQLLTSLEIETA